MAYHASAAASFKRKTRSGNRSSRMAVGIKRYQCTCCLYLRGALHLGKRICREEKFAAFSTGLSFQPAWKFVVFAADRREIPTSCADDIAIYAPTPARITVFVVNRLLSIAHWRNRDCTVLYRLNCLILTCLSSAGFRPATDETTLLDRMRIFLQPRSFFFLFLFLYFSLRQFFFNYRSHLFTTIKRQGRQVKIRDTYLTMFE